MNTDLHGQICIFTTHNLCFIRVNPWLKNFSGRRDLNPRPLEPHSSALPSCATARLRCTDYSLVATKSPELKIVAGRATAIRQTTESNGAWFSHRDLSPRRPHYQAVLRPAQ